MKKITLGLGLILSALCSQSSAASAQSWCTDPGLPTRGNRLLRVQAPVGSVVSIGYRQRNCVVNYNDSSHPIRAYRVSNSGEVEIELWDRDINVYPNGGNSLVYLSVEKAGYYGLNTTCNFGKGIPQTNAICSTNVSLNNPLPERRGGRLDPGYNPW